MLNAKQARSEMDNKESHLKRIEGLIKIQITSNDSSLRYNFNDTDPKIRNEIISELRVLGYGIGYEDNFVSVITW